MIELKGYERNYVIALGKPVKIVFNDEYMILTVSQVKKGIFINQDDEYSTYGYYWKPAKVVEEPIEIPFDVKLKLKEAWEKIK